MKKSLCVLIQHQLVNFSQHEAGRVLYTIDVSCVHVRLRFPRCIHAAKELYGDVGEVVVEDLLQHGQSLMSEVSHVCRLWESMGGACVSARVAWLSVTFQSLL